MYACVHIPGMDFPGEELVALALEFSPGIEKASDHTVLFSIAALRKLIGSPHRIASEICRSGYERKLRANLAIASNPDTAILLARNFTGVTLVTPGEEQLKLAPISIAALLADNLSPDSGLPGTLLPGG